MPLEQVRVDPGYSEAESDATFLTIEGVCKSYPARAASGAREPVTVLSDISLRARKGEFLTIIGPSGCGKSTLLNCIAGLTDYNSGTISVAGVTVDGPGDERAVVFQQSSLLPWRNVAGNIGYGIELQRRVPKEEHARRIQEAQDLVGLSGYEHHYPHELSGGMQQRTNLARALATKPQLLLMDEPFGALDALTKERLQDELSAISYRTGGSTIFITHDISEAVFLGDRVLVMSRNPGRVLELIEVPFERPRPREVTEEPEFLRLVKHLRRLLVHE